MRHHQHARAARLPPTRWRPTGRWRRCPLRSASQAHQRKDGGDAFLHQQRRPHRVHRRRSCGRRGPAPRRHGAPAAVGLGMRARAGASPGRFRFRGPGPSRSHRMVKADAMERLMPAQQWISSGALASQPREKASSSSTCSRPADASPAAGSAMSLTPSRRCAVGGKALPACRSCARGDSRVTRCEGRWLSQGVGKADRGVTRRRGMGAFSSITALAASGWRSR